MREIISIVIRARAVLTQPGLHPKYFFAHSNSCSEQFFHQRERNQPEPLGEIWVSVFWNCLFRELVSVLRNSEAENPRGIFGQIPSLLPLTSRALENAENVSCKKDREFSGLALRLLKARHED